MRVSRKAQSHAFRKRFAISKFLKIGGPWGPEQCEGILEYEGMMLSLREAAKRYGVVMRVLMQPRQAFAGRKHNQLQRSVLCATEAALHVRLSLAELPKGK